MVESITQHKKMATVIREMLKVSLLVVVVYCSGCTIVESILKLRDWC